MHREGTIFLTVGAGEDFSKGVSIVQGGHERAAVFQTETARQREECCYRHELTWYIHSGGMEGVREDNENGIENFPTFLTWKIFNIYRNRINGIKSTSM